MNREHYQHSEDITSVLCRKTVSHTLGKDTAARVTHLCWVKDTVLGFTVKQFSSSLHLPWIEQRCFPEFFAALKNVLEEFCLYQTTKVLELLYFIFVKRVHFFPEDSALRASDGMDCFPGFSHSCPTCRAGGFPSSHTWIRSAISQTTSPF